MIDTRLSLSRVNRYQSGYTIYQLGQLNSSVFILVKFKIHKGNI